MSDVVTHADLRPRAGNPESATPVAKWQSPTDSLIRAADPLCRLARCAYKNRTKFYLTNAINSRKWGQSSVVAERTRRRDGLKAERLICSRVSRASDRILKATRSRGIFCADDGRKNVSDFILDCRKASARAFWYTPTRIPEPKRVRESFDVSPPARILPLNYFCRDRETSWRDPEVNSRYERRDEAAFISLPLCGSFFLRSVSIVFSRCIVNAEGNALRRASPTARRVCWLCNGTLIRVGNDLSASLSQSELGIIPRRLVLLLNERRALWGDGRPRTMCSGGPECLT